MTGLQSEPLVAAIVAALAGSGSAALAQHLDDRSLLHIPGASGLAGRYEGREAICALLDRMATATSGTLCFETTCMTVADGGRVRIFGEVSGGRAERSLAATAMLETTFHDSRVREAWLTCADQPAWDDFWS